VRNAPECVAQRDDARARDGSAQAFWQHGSNSIVRAACAAHSTVSRSAAAATARSDKDNAAQRARRGACAGSLWPPRPRGA
jgi:hypothetical protein